MKSDAVPAGERGRVGPPPSCRTHGAVGAVGLLQLLADPHTVTPTVVSDCDKHRVLSHTMYWSNGLRKSTPPPDRQLVVHDY